MTEINFKLEMFEGPLDLMLSLISKHKLNIRDIEISVLLEQFLAYIDAAGEHDIEIAGEFLETAARLLLIKTAALLPKHESEKLKRELEGALIEYALCKATAVRLREHFVGGEIFSRLPMKRPVEWGGGSHYTLGHHVGELAEALANIADRELLAKVLRQPPKQSDINPSVTIDFVSVFSKVVHVLRSLRKNERVQIRELFIDLERSEQVATFLALLELVSHGRIAFSDDSEYIELEAPSNE
jgi:segregation and condensation protein A